MKTLDESWPCDEWFSMLFKSRTCWLKMTLLALLGSSSLGLTGCQSQRFDPDSQESLAEFPYFGRPNANVPPRKSGISRGE